MEPSNGNVSIKLSRTPILDLALLVIGLAVVAGVAELSTQMAVSFHPDAAQVSGVDLNPWRLPYYTARSWCQLQWRPSLPRCGHLARTPG